MHQQRLPRGLEQYRMTMDSTETPRTGEDNEKPVASPRLSPRSENNVKLKGFRRPGKLLEGAGGAGGPGRKSKACELSTLEN